MTEINNFEKEKKNIPNFITTLMKRYITNYIKNDI